MPMARVNRGADSELEWPETVTCNVSNACIA